MVENGLWMVESIVFKNETADQKAIATKMK